MYKAIHKFVMLASVVVLAASSTSCARSEDGESASSILGPSEPERRNGNKPGPGGGTIAWRMVIDKNGDGQPNWGDTVTFDVSTSATSSPTVTLLCSQNGREVYGATSGFYDSYPWPWTKNMILSSGAWSSGAASCTATLHPLSDSGTVLARLSFTAGA